MYSRRLSNLTHGAVKEHACQGSENRRRGLWRMRCHHVLPLFTYASNSLFLSLHLSPPMQRAPAREDGELCRTFSPFLCCFSTTVRRQDRGKTKMKGAKMVIQGFVVFNHGSSTQLVLKRRCSFKILSSHWSTECLRICMDVA